MIRRLLFIGVAITAVSAFLYVFSPDPVVRAGNARIVNVYVDGSKKTIATDAKTVRSVMKDLKIPIGKHDRTEPTLDQEMKGGEYTVNVYRARHITVTDGANNYTVMTAERSPAAIAKDAGFAVQEEDEFLYRQTEDTFEGLPGTQMVILRSKPITFSLYGKKSKVYTRAETVQAFLDEHEVELDEKDEVSMPLTQRITSGMTISIDSVVRNTKTVEEDADFPIEEIKDAQQPVGYREIKTPGTKGRKLVTYEIVIKNDGKPQRKVIKEVITKKPTKQVVIVGAKSFSGDFAAALAKLRSCEGGYDSWNPAGPYYGAYQFDRQTWSGVADPSKYGNATPAEQDAAAYQLYRSRGWQPWPVCGAGLPDTYR